MPGIPGIGHADRLAVPEVVRQDHDAVLVGQVVLPVVMHLERAETGREGDLVGGAQILFAEHQHAVAVEGVEHRPERRPVQVAGDVDAGEFRPEHVRQRRDIHPHPGPRPALRR